MVVVVVVVVVGLGGGLYSGIGGDGTIIGGHGSEFVCCGGV